MRNGYLVSCTMQGNLFYPQTEEIQDAGVQRSEADECYSSQVDSLRFEVKSTYMRFFFLVVERLDKIICFSGYICSVMYQF